MKTTRVQNKKKAIKITTNLIAITLFALIVTVIILLASLFIENKEIERDDNDSYIKAETTSYNNFQTEQVAKPEVKAQTYYVKSGDSFWSISNDFYGTGIYYTAIAYYNELSTTSILHIGDKLLVPSLDDEAFINLYNNIVSGNQTKVEEFNNSMKGQTIKAGTNHNYKYGKRMDPAVDITVPSGNDMRNYTKSVNTSSFTYLGSYKITGYTPSCEHCCEATEGIGASGVQMICGYSVAAPYNLPFGTTIYIEGYGFYVVEDRGYLGDSTIDIACPTHNDCYAITGNNINVYIVPNN